VTPLETLDQSSLALSRGTVDRVTHRRADVEWLDAAWADPASRVLVVSAGQALVTDDGDRMDLVFVAPGDAPDGTRLLLGQDADEVVYFGALRHAPGLPARGRHAARRP
jgi:NAD+ diphosphatase